MHDMSHTPLNISPFIIPIIYSPPISDAIPIDVKIIDITIDFVCLENSGFITQGGCEVKRVYSGKRFKMRAVVLICFVVEKYSCRTARRIGRKIKDKIVFNYIEINHILYTQIY